MPKKAMITKYRNLYGISTINKLLIKYKDSYICEKYRNEIDFISVPMYHPNNEAFSNLIVFITLFVTSFNFIIGFFCLLDHFLNTDIFTNQITYTIQKQ